MHSESQWRYRANRKGLRLVKYNETSPGYLQYGPYALVDRLTKEVVWAQLDAGAVERMLFDGNGHEAGRG